MKSILILAVWVITFTATALFACRIDSLLFWTPFLVFAWASSYIGRHEKHILADINAFDFDKLFTLKKN
jgi:hypothetical protein